MSVEGDKGGGGLEKKVNSENGEREMGLKIKEKRFLNLQQTGSEFKAKRSDSALATSPLSCLIKTDPLGRLPPSVRAVGSSIPYFR